MTAVIENSPKLLTGKAAVPGSCGELVQGWFDGAPAHISLPINLFSTAVARVTKTPSRGSEIFCAAENAISYSAVDLLIRNLPYEAKIDVSIDSAIPKAKGMASSTADAASAIGAVKRALGIKIDPYEIANLLLSCEPSDGVFLPGLALFDHLSGKVMKSLGGPPDLGILVLEPEACLRTIDFNKKRPRYNSEEIKQLKDAFDMALAGVREKDVLLLGKAATASSFINQKYVPKPYFGEIVELAEKAEAYGVNVAHSGTVMGILLSPDNIAGINLIKNKLDVYFRCHWHKVVSGGIF